MLKNLLKSLFVGQSTARRETDSAASVPDKGGERPVVICMSGGSAANALQGVSDFLGGLFAKQGYEFISVWPAEPGSLSRLEALLRQREVAFAFGMAGFGSGQRDFGPGFVDIWGPAGVPFFKIMGDHPAYFLPRHVESAPHIVTLYGSPEHWDFHRHHLARNNLNGLLPVLPLEAIARSEIDAERKARGPILFLKNGNDPEQLAILWKERLEPSVAAAMLEIAEELRGRLFVLNVGDIERAVVDYFMQRSIDIARNIVVMALYIAQLDDYVRRLKSTLIATSLLDLPVEVHGFHWEHVNFGGRRAKHVNHADYSLSSALIKDALAIIDMTPNTSRSPHERFVRALCRFTVCLTNRNEWIAQQFPAEHDSITFGFSPDSIREAVERTLGDRNSTVGLGLTMGETFQQRFRGPDVVAHFEALAQLVRTGWTSEPPLQNYFIWPGDPRRP